jgi:hypothetical protein
VFCASAYPVVIPERITAATNTNTLCMNLDTRLDRMTITNFLPFSVSKGVHW